MSLDAAQDLRPDGARGRRQRQPGVHAVRVDRAVHAHRPRAGCAHGVHVRDRPPAGRAVRRDRAVRACGARSRAARVAAAAGDAVEVPLRRGRRRASARSAGAYRVAGTGGGDAYAARRRSLRRSRGASMSAAVWKIRTS